MSATPAAAGAKSTLLTIFNRPNLMSDTPRTDEVSFKSDPDCCGQTCRLVRASFAQKLERENDQLRSVILAFTGELTTKQLEHHEADPPFDTSNPLLAAMYRAAKE